MSFDFLERAMAVVDSQAPVQDRTKKGVPWLKSFSFDTGTFPIRLISDAAKCPNGFHPYCVHEIQKRPVPTGKISGDDRAKYYRQVLCTLSTHGTVPVEYPDGRRGSQLAEPCPVCDLFTDIQNSFGEWADGKFAGIPEHVLEKGIQDALEDMRQGTCLRYLFPCLVRGKFVEDEKTGYEKVVQSNEMFLALLTLQPGKYGGDKSMLTQLMEQIKKHPDLFSPDTGRWLSYERKQRGSTMACEDPNSLDSVARTLFADTKYPNVISYGKGVEGIPGSNKTMSYDQAMYAFDDDWWFKSLKKKYSDFDQHAISRGLV